MDQNKHIRLLENDQKSPIFIAKKVMRIAMFRVLFILFIIIPIIEIAVLMQIGGWLGVWPTISIVIITAWLGAKNVKQQGIATLQTVQLKMAQGEMPSDEIISGLLLLISGVLLVTPGFVTDAFGLLLLIPQVRYSLIASVQKQIVVQSASTQGFTYHQHSANSDIFQQKTENYQSTPKSVQQGDIIDGEFERKE